ncbi:hypothetical protein [Bacillus sp. CECT 9360]|uniref:hypothetical protein n=1 Tax=Bacillus sp. CECT 9360 TaxID=2845821 RepID=UPI001E4C288D|nr:hypothetical protein [Bacillus sp. CECT 9360]CAH0345751.1 hypothetical protein BCI9360_02049 [Bacillus sp. CECT 9360]
MVYKQLGRSDKTLKFITLANKTIKEIEKEIIAYQNNNGKDGNLPQLEKILLEVKQMLDLQSPKRYMPSYPRTIVDSWDYKSILGNMLLELNDLYKNLD